MKKRFSLSVRMWLGFSSFTLITITILSIAFVVFFSNERDNEIFNSILTAQETLRKMNNDTNDSNESNNPRNLLINHIGIVNRSVTVMTFTDNIYKDASSQIVEKVSDSFSSQNIESKKYKINMGNYYLYYYITKQGNNGIISFRIDEYSENFNRVVVIFVPILIIFTLILSFIYAIFYSRGMTKSLKKLEISVSSIANGDYNTQITTKKQDEIGRLAIAFDNMREKLLKKESLKQEEIQYLSHELKTPVMTILSYIQAIKDNIYPKGDLNSSLEVISNQSNRLLEIINKFITITRLDFIDFKNDKIEELNLCKIIKELCNNQFAGKSNLFKLNLNEILITANKEKIIVLCENLIENAIRYAKSEVIIETSIGSDNKKSLKVSNDGELIDEKTLPQIFAPYNKGNKGISGLGLTIVKRIIDDYGWDIEAKINNSCTEFTVYFNNN